MNKILMNMLQADEYKLLHKDQYPVNTEIIYSHLIPRGSNDPNIDKVVVFGTQRLVKRIINDFNSYFFELDESQVDKLLVTFSMIAKDLFNINEYDVIHWKRLWELGYLPISINAIEEGTVIPFRVPVFTIYNTHKDFAWLINYLETLLLNNFWPAITSATKSYTLRNIMQKWYDLTDSNDNSISLRAVDFSLRGSSGMEAGEMNGLGHLLSFVSTSNLQAISSLYSYYGYDKEIFNSIPATEHSVMMVNSQEKELETIETLLDKYEGQFVSIVLDTWNYSNALEEYLPKLKHKILNRKGKLLIRPDSGDREEVVLLGLKKLEELFGTTINKDGYKILHPKVGIIFGEGISLQTANSLLEAIANEGYASSNIVLGVGSKMYGNMSRDTLGIAFKSSYAKIGNEERKIQKLSTEFKSSPKGLLKVDKDFNLIQDVNWDEVNSDSNMLKLLVKEGKIIRETTFRNIKERLWKK